MEGERKRNFFLLMCGFVLAVLVILYVFSLRSQLQEVLANQKHYEEQMESLSRVEHTEALKVNQAFLHTFFTYETTAQRYEHIKPMMTDRGYLTTHPSGQELPKSDSSVRSSMKGLKPFAYQGTKTEAEFINEFKLKTEFNHVANTETVLVKTNLVYVKDQGWKVDDIAWVGSLTGR